MIPYVIICKSCSAKLKVSVPELIGQTVDCPKCSTELTLTPPAGYKNPLKDSTRANDSTTSSFDDLDDVLGEVQDSPAPKEAPTPQQRAKKKPVAKSATEESAARVAPKSRHDQSPLVSPEPKQKRKQPKQQSHETDARDPATLDSPMLPDGSWDSDALKKRKRLLQYGSLGVLGFVLAAVGVSFLFGGSDNVRKPRLLDESPTAQNQDESTNPKQPETAKVEPDADADRNSVDNNVAAKTASLTDLDDGDAATVRSAADFTAPAISDSGFDTPTAKQPAAPLPSQPPSAQPKTPVAMPNVKQPSPRAQAEGTANVTQKEANRGDLLVKETPKGVTVGTQSQVAIGVCTSIGGRRDGSFGD